MGMLLVFLLTFQVGALTTKVVKGIYILVSTPLPILAGFINRIFALQPPNPDGIHETSKVLAGWIDFISA